MSAFKWLTFIIGIPIIAVLYAFMVEIINPSISLLTEYSSTDESATGIQWYTTFTEWLPFLLLLLLAFMLLVAIVTRREATVR